MTTKISQENCCCFFVNLFPSKNPLRLIPPSNFEISKLLNINCLQNNFALFNGSAKNSKKIRFNNPLNYLNTSEVINRIPLEKGTSF
jgi:hypothetical protein